ncbi:MAG: ComF family protein [Sulfurovum sp.]|nr:MAG: ComF family protein [Sulfurovum sp.]
MRCLSCHRLSWLTFCASCQEKLLKPTITKRTINGLDVYSFFRYQHIEDLLLTKHTAQGFNIYKALAQLSFKPFIENFMKNNRDKIYVLGVDENVKSSYSHVALLTHAMRGKNVKILHAKLMANNSVKYAGKSLQFRLENPREFHYSGVKNIEVILVDDIITTGTTLNEAKEILEKNGVEVLFALTLADVKG